MRKEEDIKNAVKCMRKGGVILYPTDTVWGIGCDATNAEAVKRVYEIKQREDSKALICLVDSDARMQRYFRNVPDVAWQLIDSLKEAEDAKPTTLILDGAINLAPNLIAEDGSLGIRITNEPFSKELCFRFQKAIVSTSANISGEPAAQNYCDIHHCDGGGAGGSGGAAAALAGQSPVRGAGGQMRLRQPPRQPTLLLFSSCFPPFSVPLFAFTRR